MKYYLICIFLFLAATVKAETAETRLFSEAESRFLSKDYELALNMYDKLLADYPLSDYVPDVQFRRGVCLFRLGRFQDSVKLFKKIYERYPTTLFFKVVPFWLGFVEYHLGNNEGALIYFEDYLKGVDTTVRPQALFYKGVCELSLKKEANARKSFEELLNATQDPSDEPYALSALSSLYLRALDFNAALMLLNRTRIDRLSLDYRDKVLLYKAESLWGLNRISEAVEIYTSLVKSVPEVSSVAFGRLFTIYQQAGDTEKLNQTVHNAEAALSGLPGILKEFWLRIGIESYKQGKYDLAAFYFSRIWDMRHALKISGLVPLYLSDILYRLGDKKKALEILIEFIDVPTEQQVFIIYKLAGYYMQAKNWDMAQNLYSKLMATFPHSNFIDESSYLKAYALYRLNRPADSLALIKQVFAQGISGNFSQKLLRLQAVVYKNLGDIEASIQTLREYTAVNSSDLQARVDLIRLYFQKESYTLLKGEIAKLYQDFPDLEGQSREFWVLIRYIEGLSAIIEKNYEKTLAVFEQISKDKILKAGLDIINPYVIFYKGWALYRLGDYKKAFEEFIAVVNEYPLHELYL
ncbi:MAG: tetratricopeptide repeat protein, partial [Spirochaetota bacterium]